MGGGQDPNYRVRAALLALPPCVSFPFLSSCSEIDNQLTDEQIWGSVSVVYNPFLRQLYRGVRGHGSYLETLTDTTPATWTSDVHDAVRLPFSHPNPLPLDHWGDALIGMEWGSDRTRSVMEKKANNMVKLAGDGTEIKGGKMCHSLRSVG